MTKKRPIPFRVPAGIFMILLLLVTGGCSTKKNTAYSRFWHRLNTRFNGYFNGNEALKEGIYELGRSRKDNFTSTIPVYQYGDHSNWQNMNAQSDKAITKAVMMIQKHSMLINGKQHNKWIDDCYLLMGKANYFKKEFYVAIGQLRYVANSSEKEDTKTEAMIWMLRCYNQLKELPDAQTMMSQVRNRSIPPKLAEAYHTSLAEYYILTENDESAIKSLEEAVRVAKPKRRKARYQFIIAQLLQQQKENKQAYTAFANTLNLKPEYELEFQSKINMARTADGTNNQSLRTLLKKMLKDDKNIEYLDQIYYALGIIDQKEDKRTEAIANFEKSLRNAQQGSNQIPVTYLALAELYFAERNYESAQAYYDSTSATLSKDHPKYAEVLRLKENLSRVVADIKVVELQDSLQALSMLTEQQLKDKFEGYIEWLKEEDERKKNAPQPNNSGGTVNMDVNKGTGYWYNQQAKTFGQAEFVKKWGNRPLEDNWRRSQKNSSAIVNNNNDPENPDGVEDPRYLVETYLKDIPKTPDDIAASNELIYDALYDLGVVYKEKIEDFPKSVEAFENLEKRNTQNRHFPLTYYQLYLLYNSLSNVDKAAYYKGLILQNYPNSQYAELLTDPSLYASKDKKDDPAEPFYQNTYSLYKGGDYYATVSNCITADSVYKESTILHRFALLKVISENKLDTLTYKFIAGLESVKNEYAGTESATTAERLLKMLKKDTEPPKVDNPGSLAGKNQDNKDSVSKKNPTINYTYDANAEHLFLILVPDVGKNLTSAKNELSGYNDANYSVSSLNVTHTLMGKSYQLMSVGKFKSASEAQNYMQAYLARNMNDKMKLGPEVKTLVISRQNFVAFFKAQDIDGYTQFYSQNYK